MVFHCGVRFRLYRYENHKLCSMRHNPIHIFPIWLGCNVHSVSNISMPRRIQKQMGEKNKMIDFFLNLADSIKNIYKKYKDKKGELDVYLAKREAKRYKKRKEEIDRLNEKITKRKQKSKYKQRLNEQKEELERKRREYRRLRGF